MRTTLTFSCSLSIALGVLMTMYFARDIKPSWQIFIWPWMLLPYLLLSLSVRGAKRLAERLIVLCATLAVACYGFWVYFDRAFVHFSSIDFSPVEVPLEQSVIAWAVWLILRWTHRGTRNENDAS
jgi:hypothetical protein